MPAVNLPNGLRLHYLDGNPTASPIVFLLHGLGADSSSWQLQIPALTAAGYRVIAPDAPGFGQSGFTRQAIGIAGVSRQILELMNALEINAFHLVGISMGGVLALQLALDAPGRVKKLVLVNTFAKLKLVNLRSLPYYLLRFILVHTLGLPTQARAVAARVFPDPNQHELRQVLIEQISQANPQAYRGMMRSLARFNASQRLAEIACPTLVVTGAADSTVPPGNQSQLSQGISCAKHIVINDAGHAVTIEQPGRFNEILLEFLSARS
jgi:pimeloyl-ACP methyl ester carboxylesterase